MRGRVALLALVFLPSPVLGQAAVGPTKRYEEVARVLDRLVTREVADKGLPALSLALVDDQEVVWAKGYGLADPARKAPATAETVYRAGSVSKLFTALAVMQLVEQGRLDLDAPVTKYLPDFKPISKYDKPITLRMILSHRSGLPREAPVGHYFDDSSPSLEKTVRSLNQAEVVCEPGTRMKYSNAGVAVAGRVVEVVAGQRFARHAHNRLLDLLGMKKSGFEPSPELTRDLAHAVLWTDYGREHDAPVVELGTGPAGGLYTTALDLGHFLRALFSGGKVVAPETLAAMTEPQFVAAGEKGGRGLGFVVEEWEGRKRLGHGGNVHGYSTQLSFLPGERLGVVVMTSRDFAGGVARHVADVALRLMAAARAGKPLPPVEETSPVGDYARRYAGRWEIIGKGSDPVGVFDLIERDGRLWRLPLAGGPRVEVRRLGKELVVDDRRLFGEKIVLDGFMREPEPGKKPPEPPAKWLGLLGEYGGEHLPVIVSEKDGRLWVCLFSAAHYPLKEHVDDVFAFPDGSLFEGETMAFARDKAGRATRLTMGTIPLERRFLDGEDGRTFKIKPLRPVDELRREALKATMPAEKGDFRKPDLVDLTALDATFRLDLRYATANNFLDTPLYTAAAKAYMQRPAAEALTRVHKKLASRGYGLLIYDAYRPWHVTKMFWEATPEKQRVFVADPSKGSRHNRGCAVDLTLYDRATGKVIDTVSGYDEFSDRAYPDYPGGTSPRRWHRELLRRAMEAEGFSVYEAEWWHFDYKDWRKYPILDERFEKLDAARGTHP